MEVGVLHSSFHLQSLVARLNDASRLLCATNIVSGDYCERIRLERHKGMLPG